MNVSKSPEWNPATDYCLVVPAAKKFPDRLPAALGGLDGGTSRGRTQR